MWVTANQVLLPFRVAMITLGCRKKWKNFKLKKKSKNCLTFKVKKQENHIYLVRVVYPILYIHFAHFFCSSVSLVMRSNNEYAVAKGAVWGRKCHLWATFLRNCFWGNYTLYCKQILNFNLAIILYFGLIVQLNKKMNKIKAIVV